jgi:hypothetical protein
MKLNKNFIYVLVIFISFNLYSQEKFETEKAEKFHHHSIAILISHTRINEGFSNGKKNAFSEPSWALNYNYAFNEKWELGLHNDIIIENFQVEKTSGGKIIERKKPITSVIVGGYKITKAFGVELGVGMEFDKDENFELARIGVEYGIEIPEPKLEVLFVIDYDIIFDAYDSFSVGIGIAKLF